MDIVPPVPIIRNKVSHGLPFHCSSRHVRQTSFNTHSFQTLPSTIFTLSNPYSRHYNPLFNPLPESKPPLPTKTKLTKMTSSNIPLLPNNLYNKHPTPIIPCRRPPLQLLHQKRPLQIQNESNCPTQNALIPLNICIFNTIL